MLDLSKYQSIGAALKDALTTFSGETCLIESDRDREKERLTYKEFQDRAHPLARALQDAGFEAGDRTSIIMTNQSKWLISAYGIFFCGGTLVPLDFKFTPREHWKLLKHSAAKILITEYPIWRQLSAAPERAMADGVKLIVVTEAPPGADLAGAKRWEEFRNSDEPHFVPRQRQDVACVVYSSGAGGDPKGCLMKHENYLEQCAPFPNLFPVWKGARYLSILPTNHAIDFMLGFFYQFVSGGTVVHLRTLRPEFIREAFAKYHINYITVVPLVLKNLRKSLQERFDALPAGRRIAFETLRFTNKLLTFRRPWRWLSRKLLKQVHQGFGGEMEAIVVGGAFTEPDVLQFFYDLGLPVANAYGMTEACMGISANDLKPFRPDTVGKPIPGVEVKIASPGADGVGEVWVRGKTVMAGYLDDPDLTADTIVDGWLHTGDMGRLKRNGHLQLVGRKKNMIVTAEGKNIFPEDVESAFVNLPVKEYCVFAANYVWARRSMSGEQLVLVVRLENNQTFTEALRGEIVASNNRLLNYKRVGGVVVFEEDFPRAGPLKIKRNVLAERLTQLDRTSAILPL